MMPVNKHTYPKGEVRLSRRYWKEKMEEEHRPIQCSGCGYRGYTDDHGNCPHCGPGRGR
jgi:hypothetical protein